VIRLDAVAKSYRASGSRFGLWGRPVAREVVVLEEVTLQVRRAEILGLVGPNGAGKTTLVEILATLQLPTGGTATVGGLDVVRQAGEVRRRIGYCPAGPDSFYPRLTVRRNLEFFAALYELPPGAARARVREVLEMVGASKAAAVVFQQLSAGMRQRLALARALVPDPPVLLLDEPTRSVDVEARCQFHALLRDRLAAEQGKTVLLVTHDMREAAAVCDRVACLRDGRISDIWPGTPRRPASRVAASRPPEGVPSRPPNGVGPLPGAPSAPAGAEPRSRLMVP